ncbi:MAG: MotA/TolQ/ExbB proton channel family protein [Bdellovibrionaceae bacterium]|nr:MotA/TolQ/ExbB proton channel family protein [Bdellovibrionales bacterium]MCB9084645.1 MotA/TolQ/ExbB proton channel family protein [Pseudobdellovibrionaceae bacterium]
MEAFSKIAIAFVQGGMWMWVILAMQIVATAIIIERAVFLFFRRKKSEVAFSQSFENVIRKGELKQAYQEAEKQQDAHPVARAIRSGLQAAMNLGGKDEIQGKMDEVLLEENARMEKRTSFLPMLANVGTLTGLLGTITGMIKSFAAVSYASPMEKATLLSQGISEAMTTTAYGLIMAIPTLLLYAVLANRANNLTEDLNQAALKVYNWLSYAYEPVGVRAARSARGEAEQTIDA